MSRMRESLRTFAEAFRNPALRRLELAWAGANIGSWSYSVGIAVYAYEHGGAKAVGIAGFARWIAAALLAPWLAVLGDRYPRRRVMISADAVRAGCLALAAVAASAGWSPLVVYVLGAVVAAAAAAFHPAEAALRPSLARTPEELTAANVVSSTISSVGLFGGPALGGIVLAVSGPAAVFAASAALMVWSASLVFAIRIREGRPERSEAEVDASFVSMVFAGFSTIFGDPRLRTVMGLYAVQLFVNGLVAVLPVVLAVRMLHLGGSGVGWLNSAEGIGGVVGAVAAVALVGVRRLGANFAVGLAFWGGPLIAIGLWVNPAAALILFVLIGISGTVLDVAGMTLLQRIAPEAVLARVFGVFETLVLVTLALGSLAAPGLIALFGDRGAFVATGALLPVAALLAWPRLRAIDREAVLPERQLELLRGIPIFAPLAAPELERLASGLVPVEVEPMTAVFEQGDRGDRFSVIDEGRAVVEVDGVEVAELGRGDFFGEIALLRDVPRTATVRALEPLKLWALDRELFISVVTGHAPSLEAAESVVGTRLAGPVRA